MTSAAADMLEDIERETVDFRPNYDESRLEPKVLPGRFPNLLVNGGAGIAVAMASSIPPHNPAEVARAIIATIDDPDITLAGLLEHLPGPRLPDRRADLRPAGDPRRVRDRPGDPGDAGPVRDRGAARRGRRTS